VQRRDALALLAWGAVAGCARRDPASVEATTGSAVGERFAVDGPEGVAVTVTATDARGEPFAVRLRPGADGHVDPAHRVGANATAVRRRAGSATVRSRGLAGDPVRMLFHRMTPAASPTPPTFVAWTGDEPTGRVAVTASTVDGSTSATVDRTVVDPAVTTRRIAVGDLTGLAVDPPGEGPHPGVLVFHGSAGTVPGRSRPTGTRSSHPGISAPRDCRSRWTTSPSSTSTAPSPTSPDATTSATARWGSPVSRGGSRRPC
jgi:hypothetical protein